MLLIFDRRNDAELSPVKDVDHFNLASNIQISCCRTVLRLVEQIGVPELFEGEIEELIRAHRPSQLLLVVRDYLLKVCAKDFFAIT